MIYAIKVENGVVTNRAKFKDADSLIDGWEVCPEGVGIGHIKSGDSFAAPVSSPTPTTEADYARATQSVLDTKARELGYANIHTAVTYADEPTVAKFQAEGQALRAWRSLVWAAAYQTLADVEAGNREQPTVEQFVAELPAYA